MSRPTSIWSVECACNATVEWPDATRETHCPKCGRLLVIAAWPNQPLMTVAPEAKR